MTVFDKILNDEIPVKKVYEDDIVLAFEDINPQAPTHVLVIPKIKFKSFSDLKDKSATIVGDYFCKVSHVASVLGLDNDGYRIIFNCGKHGWQTVDYLHAHILGGKQLAGWDGQR